MLVPRAPALLPLTSDSLYHVPAAQLESAMNSFPAAAASAPSPSAPASSPAAASAASTAASPFPFPFPFAPPGSSTGGGSSAAPQMDFAALLQSFQSGKTMI